MLLTYNSQIAIPPSSGATASAVCPVPAGVKFWHFTTHTHQRASSATLQAFPSFDTFVVTTNPAAPLIQEFGPPFYTFTGGDQLRYSCNYFNEQGFAIRSGGDELLDENCVGIGYFFPATRPRVCIDNTRNPSYPSRWRREAPRLTSENKKEGSALWPLLATLTMQTLATTAAFSVPAVAPAIARAEPRRQHRSGRDARPRSCAQQPMGRRCD